MSNERAEKRIDELPELETVEDDVMVPGEYNGVAYKIKAKKLKGKTSGSGLTEEVKQALLTVALHAGYDDTHGRDYYDALYAALYPPANLVSISAAFEQGGNTVYDTDTLDSLKQYLTVTGTYDDASTKAITNYTLSGTLTEGTSTVTVSYNGKSATFSVTVTHYEAAVTGISALFTQGDATIFETDSLDDLKQYLVVTATYEGGTTATVTGYILSGTLTEGTSTITVTYNGFTDTFTVTVTAAPAQTVEMSAFLRHNSIKDSGFKFYSDGGETEYSDSKLPNVSNGLTAVSDEFDTDHTLKITLTPTANVYQCMLFGSTNFDNSFALGAGNGDGYWLKYITPSSDVFAYGWSTAPHTFTASVKAGCRFMILSHPSGPSDIDTITVEVV